MYIENKSGGPSGNHIGRVSFSKTGRSLYYNGKTFRSLSGAGFKANFYDVESGEHYWISGPKKNGEDGLYGPRPTPIDQDVREEYWMKIRKLPEKKGRKTT